MDGLLDDIHALANNLVTSDLCFQEINTPARERWAFVLTHFPAARNAGLTRPVDPALHEVLLHGSYFETYAAVEYTRLRYLYFLHMEESALNLPHINKMELVATEVWYTRLMDRMTQLEPAHRDLDDEFKIVPAKGPVAVRHGWRH